MCGRPHDRRKSRARRFGDMRPSHGINTRRAGEQIQRLPLAARLLAMGPLITMEPGPEALDRNPFLEDNAMRHESERTRRAHVRGHAGKYVSVHYLS